MTKPALENNHNVYILGAGFSAPAGLPLIANFMERMRDSLDWIKQSGREMEAQAIERVLEFRLKAAAAAYRTQLDPDNVEELFSLASAEGQEGLDADMRRAIAATLDFCGRSPDTDFRILVGDASRIGSRFGAGWRVNPHAASMDFAGKAVVSGTRYQVLCAALTGFISEEPTEHKNTFVTFNYDLLVDQALHAAGRCVDYGFAEGVQDTQVEWIEQSSSSVEVLKLHGSVNWAVTAAAAPRVRAFSSYGDVVAQGLAPLLVPPTWQKALGGHLEAVWGCAVRAIRTATRLVVIGFSMPRTDQHFRYLIAAGLRENISLRKIIFVDPAAVALGARIDEIFRPELRERRVLETWPCKVFDLLDTGVEPERALLPRLGRSPAADTFIRRS